MLEKALRLLLVLVRDVPLDLLEGSAEGRSRPLDALDLSQLGEHVQALAQRIELSSLGDVPRFLVDLLPQFALRASSPSCDSARPAAQYCAWVRQNSRVLLHVQVLAEIVIEVAQLSPVEFALPI